LNIVTKKPGDTFDASARALYGMFGQYAAEVALGGPISDTFGARLAVTRTGGKAGSRIRTPGGMRPDDNTAAGRLTLLYKLAGT